VPGGTQAIHLRTDVATVVPLDAGSHDRRASVKLSVLDLHLRPDQLLELVPADLRDRTHRSLERRPEPARTP